MINNYNLKELFDNLKKEDKEKWFDILYGLTYGIDKEYHKKFHELLKENKFDFIYGEEEEEGFIIISPEEIVKCINMEFNESLNMLNMSLSNNIKNETKLKQLDKIFSDYKIKKDVTDIIESVKYEKYSEQMITTLKFELLKYFNKMRDVNKIKRRVLK